MLLLGGHIYGYQANENRCIIIFLILVIFAVWGNFIQRGRGVDRLMVQLQCVQVSGQTVNGHFIVDVFDMFVDGRGA